MVDFVMLYVKVWRAAKHRLQRQLGLTPHIALVAQETTRAQVPPVGVDQKLKLVIEKGHTHMVTLTNTMTTTVPVDSGNTHNCKGARFC